MHCTLQGWSRADSSVPIGRGCVSWYIYMHVCVCVCVSVLTPTERQTCRKNPQTRRQVRLCAHRAGQLLFYKMMFLCVFPPSERRRRAEGRFIQLHTDAMVLLIFDMLWLWQLPRLLLDAAFFSPYLKARISQQKTLAMGVKCLFVTVAFYFIFFIFLLLLQILHICSQIWICWGSFAWDTVAKPVLTSEQRFIHYH